MPGKEIVQDEQQITPDLNAIMEAGMQKFDGELEQAAAGTKAPEAANAPDPAAAPEVKPPEKKPDEKPAAPGSTETPVETKPAAAEPAPRFKSHEEAEKGYKHLQGEKTRTDEELVRLRSENEQLKTVDQRKAAADKAATHLRTMIVSENKKALAEINKLDADAEGYDDKVSEIWAQKDLAILNFQPTQGLPATPAPAAPAIPAPAAVKDEERGTRDESATPAADPNKVILDRVAELATAEGIDPTDEFFKMACQTTPANNESGKPISIDDQIRHAIGRTQTYLTAQGRAIGASADEQRRRQQAADLPLGEGNDGTRLPSSAAAPVARSLNDALEKVAEERRL